MEDQWVGMGGGDGELTVNDGRERKPYETFPSLNIQMDLNIGGWENRGEGRVREGPSVVDHNIFPIYNIYFLSCIAMACR